MATQLTFAELTSAASTAIGFEYQYYYFLYRVLRLRMSETVGLEIMDDVHTALSTNHQILFQLKHTLQRNADGTHSNLTTYDPDLWKTLSNWSLLIRDAKDGRDSEPRQIEFISKTEFMLVTNKAESISCRALDMIEDPSRAMDSLKCLKAATKDKSIQCYIQNLVDLGEPVLMSFVGKIRLSLNVNDVVELCKNAIVEHHIPPGRVDDLFRDLDSQIRQDNFITIREAQPVIISFDDFSRKYRRFFDLAHNTELVVRSYYEPLPSSLDDQTFIKQLVSVGDITLADTDEIASFTRLMLTVKTNLTNWQLGGELTENEVNQFNKEAIVRWSNEFRSAYRKPLLLGEKACALKVLDRMRRERLSISGQEMDTEFSNGEYYCLSDIPEIGWEHDWEEKYK